MLIELETTKPLAQIDRDLHAAAARHGFGVLALHNLGETIRSKGVEFSGECLVYEVCNPWQASRALQASFAVATALPCRIAIYRTDQGYKLATIRPTALMAMFQAAGLDVVAGEVEATLSAIMQETAGA